MFNRIRHLFSHASHERCVPLSRRHRSPVPVGAAVTPRDRVAHNWFATTEAL